jgi:hypothetical protein
MFYANWDAQEKGLGDQDFLIIMYNAHFIKLPTEHTTLHPFPTLIAYSLLLEQYLSYYLHQPLIPPSQPWVLPNPNVSMRGPFGAQYWPQGHCLDFNESACHVVGGVWMGWNYNAFYCENP